MTAGVVAGARSCAPARGRSYDYGYGGSAMSADLESAADEEWTAEQCAEYVGVRPVTWRSYSYRPTRDNPAPKPKRHIGRTPVWSASEVREWKANRPGSPVVNAPTAGS